MCLFVKKIDYLSIITTSFKQPTNSKFQTNFKPIHSIKMSFNRYTTLFKNINDLCDCGYTASDVKEILKDSVMQLQNAENLFNSRRAKHFRLEKLLPSADKTDFPLSLEILKLRNFIEACRCYVLLYSHKCEYVKSVNVRNFLRRYLSFNNTQLMGLLESRDDEEAAVADSLIRKRNIYGPSLI